ASLREGIACGVVRLRQRACDRADAHDRVLVERGGPGVLPRIRGQHGSTDQGGPSSLCRYLHSGQAARDGCASLPSDAPAPCTAGGRPDRPGHGRCTVRRPVLNLTRLLLTGALLLPVLPEAAEAQRISDQAAATRSAASSTPRVTQSSETESYEVGGIRVVHRHGMANDVVAANLYLLGGTRLTNWEKAGIEPMLLLASERGTRTYPREAVRLAMAAQGTSIVTGAESDWTMFGARATTG